MKYIFTLFGRLLITIYSFNGLFFLYNFIFQNLSLVATLFYYYENIFCQLVSSIFYIIFAILTSNVLVIPTYEFLCFPFLRYINPLSHFESFNYIIKDNKNIKFNYKDITKKNNKSLNMFLFFLSILFLWLYYRVIF